MILRARIIVTMSGPPIENAAVAIEERKIVDVGSFSEVRARNTGDVIDLGEQILLPGLINAHCHLDYTCLRGKIAPRKSFADWIRAINTEKAELLPNDYIRSINQGFAEAQRFGTTTIANLTAFPELIASIRAPIRTWWFAEMIDVREPGRAPAIVERAVELLSSTEHWGLAPHALFTASAALYRACQKNDVLLTTHLAESAQEMSMFRDDVGPLHDFLKEIGRDMSDCGGRTPIETFFKMRDSSTSVGTTKNWLLVHVNEFSKDDLELLTRLKAKSSIVHCPRSHRYFGREPFRLHKFRELNFNLCLGTDSLGSNDDLSLFGEMRALQEIPPSLSPREILKMVTVNSARALRRADELGQIAPGYLADLIAIPATPAASDVFEQIISFDNSVPWMMIGGKVMRR